MRLFHQFLTRAGATGCITDVREYNDFLDVVIL